MCFRQTLTTDFSAKPPATIKAPVAEKNTKFSLEIHGLIKSDHTVEWSRVPKPFLPAIQQNQMISVATGQQLANLNGGQGTQASSCDVDALSQDDERESLIAEVENLCCSYDVKRLDIEQALSKLYKKPTTLESIPLKGLGTLATEDGFKNVLKHIDK